MVEAWARTVQWSHKGTTHQLKYLNSGSHIEVAIQDLVASYGVPRPLEENPRHGRGAERTRW